MSVLAEEKAYIASKLSPEAQNRLTVIYDDMQSRLLDEKARTPIKYATKPELIIKNQESKELNEILLCNTKTAVKALYATNDTLFDRLNLVFHAKNIRERYGYDLPLLILSQDKNPYYYSEELIRKDLEQAELLIKSDQFPFDTSSFPVYTYDTSVLIGPGRFKIILGDDGKPIQKLDAAGQPVFETKNKTYQEELLVNLFKLGQPGLTSLKEIKESSTPINKDSILAQIAVLGGEQRETGLLRNLNTDKRDEFFLRSVALGHSQIIESLLSQGYNPTLETWKQSVDIALKNNHIELHQQLSEFYVRASSQHQLVQDELNKIQDMESIKGLEELIRVYDKFNKLGIRDTDLEKLLLNQNSYNEYNVSQLPTLVKLLSNSEIFLQSYAQFKSHKELSFDLNLILSSYFYGDNEAAKLMTLYSKKGTELAEHYCDLLKLDSKMALKIYPFLLDSEAKTKAEVKELTQKECENLVAKLEKKLEIVNSDDPQFQLIKEANEKYSQQLKNDNTIIELIEIKDNLLKDSQTLNTLFEPIVEKQRSLRDALIHYKDSPTEPAFKELMVSYQELVNLASLKLLDPQLESEIISSIPTPSKDECQTIYDEIISKLRKTTNDINYLNKQFGSDFMEPPGQDVFDRMEFPKNYLDIFFLKMSTETPESDILMSDMKTVASMVEIMRQQLDLNSSNKLRQFNTPTYSKNKEIIKNEVEKLISIFLIAADTDLIQLLNDKHEKAISLQDKLYECTQLVPKEVLTPPLKQFAIEYEQTHAIQASTEVR